MYTEKKASFARALDHNTQVSHRLSILHKCRCAFLLTPKFETAGRQYDCVVSTNVLSQWGGVFLRTDLRYFS